MVSKKSLIFFKTHFVVHAVISQIDELFILKVSLYVTHTFLKTFDYFTYIIQIYLLNIKSLILKKKIVLTFISRLCFYINLNILQFHY